MSSRNLRQFLTPSLIVMRFITKALVLSSQNHCPPKTVTSFMDDPLVALSMKGKHMIVCKTLVGFIDCFCQSKCLQKTKSVLVTLLQTLI